jgi:3-methyladenine DNA glycosylase AlkD
VSAVSLQRAIRRSLREQRNPERAIEQQKYMKSSMPYAGLGMPALRAITKAAVKAGPIDEPAEWREAILTLWREAKVREERYAAIELLRYDPYARKWLLPDCICIMREFIVTGAWWDYVDAIATSSLGSLLRSFPDQMKPLMQEWATDDDVWIRRSAILAQLKLKEATDEALLVHAIEHSWQDPDFFARKAIGWALREYSKTRPDFVASYIRENEAFLSPLSVREGLTVLRKRANR